jgi:hypothetical protein
LLRKLKNSRTRMRLSRRRSKLRMPSKTISTLLVTQWTKRRSRTSSQLKKRKPLKRPRTKPSNGWNQTRTLNVKNMKRSWKTWKPSSTPWWPVSTKRPEDLKEVLEVCQEVCPEVCQEVCPEDSPEVCPEVCPDKTLTPLITRVLMLMKLIDQTIYLYYAKSYKIIILIILIIQNLHCQTDYHVSFNFFY